MARRNNKSFQKALAAQAARKHELAEQTRLDDLQRVLTKVENDAVVDGYARSFWFIQRMDRWDPHKIGFEYMGASEFEWGAIPRALRAMNAAGELVIRTAPITVAGVTRGVIFVAPAAEIDQKITALQRWIDAGMHSKEWTNFKAVHTGNYEWQEPDWVHTVAWFSLGTGLMWTHEEEVARKLVALLSQHAELDIKNNSQG